MKNKTKIIEEITKRDAINKNWIYSKYNEIQNSLKNILQTQRKHEIKLKATWKIN
jgi:translation elongation factor EF-1alpha